MFKYILLIFFWILLSLVLTINFQPSNKNTLISASLQSNYPDKSQSELRTMVCDQAVKEAKLKKIPLVLNYPLVGRSAFIGFDDNGTPRYYAGTTQRLAIGSGVNLLWESGSYNLHGSGMTVGVWDVGAVKATHQEFKEDSEASRVINMTIKPLSHHSTHVTGIIASTGKSDSSGHAWTINYDHIVSRTTHGMASLTDVDAYDYDNDIVTFESKADNYLVSNHSYGQVCGWLKSDENTYRWAGGVGNLEDRDFGRYHPRSAGIDETCYGHQFILPIISAGNDRNHSYHDEIAALNPPQYYLYSDDNKENPLPFVRDEAPYEDGRNGGFGTITPPATSKNGLSVGAINDMVDSTNEQINFSTKLDPVTKFTSFGPCDDGRLKPDIVAMGGFTYAPIATEASDIDYAYSYGTSQAAPVVSGSALLLQEFYEQQTGTYMRSASLKALLLHTAYDLGRVGPDYSYGWGYLDAEHAIHTLEKSILAGSSSTLQELALSDTMTKEMPLVADGNQPLVATLVWTDPAHAVIGGNNDSTPALINDLDLRISSKGQVFQPWVLDRLQPEALATKGDNVVDNVEQVKIAAPVAEQTYTLSVDHKGTLVNGHQNYSLIVSGIKNFYLTHANKYIPNANLQNQAVFGEAAASVSYDLKVVNMTSKPTVISSFTFSNNENFSTTSLGMVVPAHSFLELPVTYHPTSSFESNTDIHISFGNGKSFDLKLYGHVDSLAIPPVDETLLVDFGTIISESEWTKTLCLNNDLAEEINITSVVEPTTLNFSVSIDESPIPVGGIRSFQVTYHPQQEGNHQDTFVVNLSNGASVTFNLSGSAALFDINNSYDPNPSPIAPPTNSGNDDLNVNYPNKITYTIHPGWNLISIPFSEVSHSIHAFENLGYTMWKWNARSQCYVKLNDLAYLEGIWVYSHNSEAKVFDFVGIVPKAPEVNILPGWGLYGTSKITQTSGFPAYINSIFQWSLGRYLETLQLNPTKGYWFFNQSSQTETLQL